jgi:hypothetical protein
MLKPDQMSLPDVAKLPVTELPFAQAALRRMHSQGIATAKQLLEMASRDAQKLKQATGVSATKIMRILLEVVGGDLPDFTNVAVCANQLPPAGVAATSTGSLLGSFGGPLGARPSKPLLAYLENLTDLPTYVSLAPKMQPVGNQGVWPTCVGFSANAMREFELGRAMSPGYAYRGAKALDGFRGDGSFLRYALQHMYRVGHVDETLYDYTATIRATPIDHLTEKAAPARVGGWTSVDVTGPIGFLPKLMWASLAGRLRPELGPRPIGIGLRLFQSFVTTSTALDGLIYKPFPGEKEYGCHAMCVVGYIDGKDPANPYGLSYFMVRNSWGNTWAAENPFNAPGHAMIPAMLFADRKNVVEVVMSLGVAA